MSTTKRKKQYQNNKDAAVGSECICPICGGAFTKRQYYQAFCCSSCREKFHNNKKTGHRGDYYRQYNLMHPERLTRIGINPLTDEEKANWVHPFSEEGVQGKG